MGRLTAIVLGSAAGGGLPQWNCRCPVCRLAWSGDGRVRARTQACLAVSGDRETWVLINASPDLREQIRAARALHPRAEVRGSPIKAVVLTGAEIDQVAGLLTLREREPFTVHATAVTLAALAENTMFDALAPELVARHAIAPGAPIPLPGGLTAELFTVPGKVPLYLEDDAPESATESGVNVGVEIALGRARIVYIPGAAAVTAEMRERCLRAGAVLFDGTLFRDDEMIASGTGGKTGRRMGHVPIAGADGSLAALSGVPGRRVLVHINNTNPILVEDSPEREHVRSQGWEVGEDGMEIILEAR
jgi:pyrroloquinoline quinone biosynthesis protein B